jgi:hypothetical protein
MTTYGLYDQEGTLKQVVTIKDDGRGEWTFMDDLGAFYMDKDSRVDIETKIQWLELHEPHAAEWRTERWIIRRLPPRR